MNISDDISAPNTSGVTEEIQKVIVGDLEAVSLHQENKLLLLNKRIGVSISDHEELGELGFSTIHLRDLIIEIARHLLINGATLIYGGDLRKEGFTSMFSELAFQYRSKRGPKDKCFVNYFAYPIHCLITKQNELEFIKNRTEIKKVPPPEDLKVNDKAYLPPDTIEARLAWARSLTEMRNSMISNSDARILVGGKLSNYLGKLPGIIEEAKITLEQKKPLYLIGALGGASREVINALEGNSFLYPKNSFHQSVEYQDFKNRYYSQYKDEINSDTDAAFFRQFGITGLAEINGLTVEENRRLFETPHLSEMIYYVFKGLKRLKPS